MRGTDARLSSPNDLADAIRRSYGVVVTSLVRFDAGDEARTWRAIGERDLFVHESPAWRTEAELTWCHALLDLLAPRLPEAIRPIRTTRATFVRHEDRLITVYPWVEGAHLDRGDHGQRRAAAGLLARTHRELREIAMERRPLPHLSNPSLTVFTVPSMFRDAELDAAHARIQRLGLERGLIHGDFYRRNLLWMSERIVALVDWHDAHEDLLVSELASAAWQFGKDASGTTAIPGRIRQFIADYLSAGGPAQASRPEVLVSLMRWRIRAEMRTSLALEARGVPTDIAYRSVLAAAFQSLRDLVL